jgi:(S)-ureidoglycine---glyoxylate transaminase
MLADFGIEIGTSFGPRVGRIWRIGNSVLNSDKGACLRFQPVVLRRRVRNGVSPGL